MFRTKGFTFLEILIVISIVVLISTIITASVRRYTAHQALVSVAVTLVSKLDDARSRTLSSQDASQYGVHFESGSVTLFQGETYSPAGSTNETTALDERITIVPALSGGGSTVVFERLTGETEAYGVLTLSLAGSASTTRTIVVQQTGLVSQH